MAHKVIGVLAGLTFLLLLGYLVLEEDIRFHVWMHRLQREATHSGLFLRGLPTEYQDPACWRAYFDDGYSPEEAVKDFHETIDC